MSLPNAQPRWTSRTQVGNVFTIEPMICEGTAQHLMWNDQWTATTKDGKRSAQFEHTLLITETGAVPLTGRLESSNPFFWEAGGYEVPAPPESRVAAPRVAPSSASASDGVQAASDAPTKGFASASAAKKAARGKAVAKKKKKGRK